MDEPRSGMMPEAEVRKPVGVYLMAFYFTAVWLFSLGSLIYVVFYKFSPEMRHRLVSTAALAPLLIADLNGLLTVVAAWLLVAMRRVGAGLMLVSTMLLLALCTLSWPVLLQRYSSHPTPALLHPLLLGGSNIVLHIAATIYAFHLSKRRLLR